MPETELRWRKKQKNEMINYDTSKNCKKYVKGMCLIDKKLYRHNTISIGLLTSRSNLHLHKIQVKLPKIYKF